MIVFNWLVNNGLWRDLVSAGILVPLMRVMAMKPIQHLEDLINEIRVEGREHLDLVRLVKKVNSDDKTPS